jgi:nucleoside-diphosphate-sugar epimerase
MPRLLTLGFGYSAGAVVAGLGAVWSVTVTARSDAKVAALRARGFDALRYDGSAPCPDLARALARTTHLLVTAAPAPDDPLLARHRADVEAAPDLAWIGYLSSIGVYGDRGGAWIDEQAEPAPANERARRRAEAEQAWLALGRARGTPTQLYRLGGIYGPGRNALVGLAEGWQQRIVKPGQVFNRIHVEDIGGLVRAGMAQPLAGPVLHGVDDAPAPPQDVVVYAAGLLGVPPPPEIPFDKGDLSPMAREFYGQNKRVANAATKQALGYRFVYPSYREGLRALAAAGEGLTAPDSRR